MKNTIIIRLNQYKELHSAVSPEWEPGSLKKQWEPGWLKKHYKCAVVNRFNPGYGRIALSFETEQDMIWFKLKHL